MEQNTTNAFEKNQICDITCKPVTLFVPCLGSSLQILFKLLLLTLFLNKEDKYNQELRLF